MDPFIIIKNYRQPKPEDIPPAPRIFLRELDPNTLSSRTAASKIQSRLYCE
jgi:hypothetical protein